jgi:bifunctional DNA-binding transcriptional regulator/antitoxin component of YhaV-PrlF toxin-antitoxin module
MDLLHLVDRLEELVASAQKMPIGNRAILDRRRLLDVVDQMRIAVPQEVREAQDIVAHRDAIRREAEEEGRILLAQAEERASRLVEQHEITQAARHRAEEIASEAEARLEERIAEANADIQQRIQESRQIAREQMSAADDYARELLLRLQRQLEAFVSSVRNGVEQLEPQAPTLRRDTAAAPIVRAPAARPAREVRDEEFEDEPPFEEQPEPRGATRSPIPLHREDEGDDLENLLRPRQRDAQQAPVVIDDFEHEPLDDDPLLRPRESREPRLPRGDERARTRRDEDDYADDE